MRLIKKNGALFHMCTLDGFHSIFIWVSIILKSDLMVFGMELFIED